LSWHTLSQQFVLGFEELDLHLQVILRRLGQQKQEGLEESLHSDRILKIAGDFDGWQPFCTPGGGRLKRRHRFFCEFTSTV